MFPGRYFPDRYFAPRYWPVGGTAVIVPGLEFTARGRLHWTIDVGLTHYTAQGRVHYTIPEEDA